MRVRGVVPHACELVRRAVEDDRPAHEDEALDVANEIGKFARPKSIRFADAVPKTRSGKIMRRLLRDVASGKETKGDMTTLEDISVLAKLRGEEG